MQIWLKPQAEIQRNKGAGTKQHRYYGIQLALTKFIKTNKIPTFWLNLFASIYKTLINLFSHTIDNPEPRIDDPGNYIFNSENR